MKPERITQLVISAIHIPIVALQIKNDSPIFAACFAALGGAWLATAMYGSLYDEAMDLCRMEQRRADRMAAERER